MHICFALQEYFDGACSIPLGWAAAVTPPVELDSHVFLFRHEFQMGSVHLEKEDPKTVSATCWGGSSRYETMGAKPQRNRFPTFVHQQGPDPVVRRTCPLGDITISYCNGYCHQKSNGG